MREYLESDIELIILGKVLSKTKLRLIQNKAKCYLITRGESRNLPNKSSVQEQRVSLLLRIKLNVSYMLTIFQPCSMQKPITRAPRCLSEDELKNHPLQVGGADND